ncbi:MAG: hypothetical protein WCC36_00870 [Gammaproteobacteria bacterium]
MKRFFGIWIDLCLLRAGPQDLPASEVLLALALLAYLAVNVALSLLSWPLRQALAVSLTDLLVLSLFAWAALQWRGKPARFRQTLTALAGTGTVLGLLALPTVAALMAAHRAGGGSGLLGLAWLALLVWSLVVLGHILRHALALSFATGIALGVLYTVLSYGLAQVLFGAVS